MSSTISIKLTWSCPRSQNEARYLLDILTLGGLFGFFTPQYCEPDQLPPFPAAGPNVLQAMKRAVAEKDYPDVPLSISDRAIVAFDDIATLYNNRRDHSPDAADLSFNLAGNVAVKLLSTTVQEVRPVFRHLQSVAGLKELYRTTCIDVIVSFRPLDNPRSASCYLILSSEAWLLRSQDAATCFPMSCVEENWRTLLRVVESNLRAYRPALVEMDAEPTALRQIGELDVTAGLLNLTSYGSNS